MIDSIQNVLDIAETPVLLEAVVKNITLMAKLSPQHLGRHFQNTVDILVGWHIDINLEPQLIECISAALVCFRDCWTKDMVFSTDLLEQFLEDMDAYCSVSVCVCVCMCDRANQVKSSVLTVCVCVCSDRNCLVLMMEFQLAILKRAPPLNSVWLDCQPSSSELVHCVVVCVYPYHHSHCVYRVFTTVLRSLGTCFSPSRCPEISPDFVQRVSYWLHTHTHTHTHILTDCESCESVCAHSS